MQVCRGLSHAHENGVVHRDIKPRQHLRDDRRHREDHGFRRGSLDAVVTDAVGTRRGHGGLHGARANLRQRIDGRADVFSVGVVLYEVLTTEHLFPGDSLEAIFFATLSKKPPLLSLPDGTELPALQKILHRALARHPEKRYPSAEELGQALETFLDQHANALPPNTIFTARASATGGSSNRQRPTVQAPAPIRVPELTPSVSPRPAARARPRGRRGRTGRRNRLLLVAALVLVAAVTAGAYILFLPQPETSRSHASAPPRPEPPERKAAPIEEPAASEVSATLLADAALAVSQDRLDTARSLIAHGESVRLRRPALGHPARTAPRQGSGCRVEVARERLRSRRPTPSPRGAIPKSPRRLSTSHAARPDQSRRARGPR